MLKSHPYARTGRCPCRIGPEAVRHAAALYARNPDPAAFARAMEAERVIGKRIDYDPQARVLYVTKVWADTCGGGCPDNDCPIGHRCHCDHYNHSRQTHPRTACQCGAEFYRPMFGPLLGADVWLEPYRTVLSGDAECVIAVHIGQKQPPAPARDAATPHPTSPGDNPSSM